MIFRDEFPLLLSYTQA